MNSIDWSRRRLAIGAAGLAGFVDAAGFLSANGYFVSFMSGNTTRLGVDLITAPWTAATPALLILGFVLGVVGGALVAAKYHSQRKFAVLILVTALLGAAAMSRLANWPDAAMASLVLAMGALNNTFQKDGEVSVGLTYMTGALVRLGQGLANRLLGAEGAGWDGWLLLWVGLALGAIGGAYAQLTWPDLALWLAVTWAFALALFARRIAVS